MDGFPVGSVGWKVDGDPIVVARVRVVQFAIENRSVIGCGVRHLASRKIGAAGSMPVLQIDSVALLGQVSVRRQI